LAGEAKEEQLNDLRRKVVGYEENAGSEIL
jgi:hypothetical protein